MADERTRIARELHDLIAHSVSLMGIQASAARRMLDPGADGPRDALLAVESTSGQALAEMHPMLGVLRPGDEEMTLSPPPSLDQLEELVGTVKAAGLRVDLVIDGKRRPGSSCPHTDRSERRRASARQVAQGDGELGRGHRKPVLRQRLGPAACAAEPVMT